jgi:hypothetical protein
VSDLIQRQWRFSELFETLLTWARTHGYKVRLGEAWRTEQQAQWNALHGLGIVNSIHRDRCAVDLIFHDCEGVELDTVEGVAPIGAYWKSLGPECRWGGDFPKVDIWHFSLAFGGRQ